MQDIINQAKELAKKETGKTVRPLFDIANRAGQMLAEKLNADKEIVALGALLMDLKLKQAREENRLPDHVKMSLEASKEFLEQFDLDEEIKGKIYNCIEAHHGDVPFRCLEAEICANADCYKFLHPKGILLYVCILNGRCNDFKKALEGVEAKMEEKYKILSLDIAKQELEPYYQMFKKLFKAAK